MRERTKEREEIEKTKRGGRESVRECERGERKEKRDRENEKHEERRTRGKREERRREIGVRKRQFNGSRTDKSAIRFSRCIRS